MPSSADDTARRLAAVSRVVAEEYRRRVVTAAERLGDDVAGWSALTVRLLEECRTAPAAALAFLRLVPWTAGRPDREAWTRAVLAIAAVSPPLAASFAEASAALAGAIPGARFAAFAAQAIGLRTAPGWRGERLAHLFVSAAESGLSRLGPSQYALWHVAVVAMAPALPEAPGFRVLPAVVAEWSDAEREDWLVWVATAARQRPQAGVTIYRDTPAAVGRLAPAVRARVLAACRPAGAAADPAAQEAVAPVLGALVSATPESARGAALEHLRAVADALPAAVPALLRSLGRLYEEAAPARVAEWMSHGLGLVTAAPAAAAAFFALESRTSMRVLQASPTAVVLEDVQGVLRRYVHMLSGDTAVLRGEGVLRLGLPLEEAAGPGGALPARIDCGPTVEDNARVYRLLAALLAGRRRAGTYADAAVLARVRNEERPLVEPCFRLADGVRVAARLSAGFPGLALELRWLGDHLLARWRDAGVVEPAFLCDVLLAAMLAGEARAAGLPDWLAPAAAVALPLLRPLGAADATAADAALTAELLARMVPFPIVGDPSAAELSEYARFMLELGGGEDAYPLAGEDALGAPGEAWLHDDEAAGPPEIDPAVQILVDELLDAATASGRPLDPEELARLLEAGLLDRLSQTQGLTPQQAGLYVTQLMGKLLGALPERVALGDGPAAPRRALRATPDDRSPVLHYDEWDHTIADYRPAWCALREVGIAEDAGVFFTRTLERHAALLPEIRRHFQRVQPETYRPVRGLEDGADFDLNAVVDARVQRRAGHSASTKLYTARVRQEREVATLFLLDMSASTDEAPPSADGRRIIDIGKEALVMMSAALDEMGDAFAIYGFSGQGRDRVEVYPVKGFAERLSPAVKGRIGGIEPKGSTRMGTAIRHALTAMQRVTAPARHLILLSDGFPQDLDYGQDRHSHTYGIRDTAVALREAAMAGVQTFCITVDLAGHDYLREMCDPRRYLVIERVADLPRELPKIYQRLVRAA